MPLNVLNSAVLALAVALQVEAATFNLPAEWPTCSRSLNKEDFEKCLEVAGQKAITDLCLNGAPSLSIPPMEPLVLSELHIGHGRGPVAIDLSFKDLRIYGMHGAVVVGPTEANLNRSTFSTGIRFSEDLRLEAHYRMSGRVLVMPIRGEGRCNISLSEVHGKSRWEGETVKKKGQEYLKITRFWFDFDTKRLRMNFENLWNGNKAMSNNINAFLNDNWKEILVDLKPAVEEAFGAAFKEITNRITTKVPYQTLFPE